MSFSQIEFLILLLLCVVAMRLLKNAVARKALLLIASLYFFAWVDVRFLPLLLGYVTIGYGAIYGMAHCQGEGRRKVICISAVACFLLGLCVFKYANFFIGSLNVFFGVNIGTLRWVLPLGISFYTFQGISVVMDVYRKQIQPCSFLDFALAICYFPKLVAGPIVRMSDFLMEIPPPPVGPGGL